MKINVKDSDRLDMAFTEANRKCSARLADRSDVVKYIEKIERSLGAKGVPATHRKGLRFNIQPSAEKLPNAYYKRGLPMATSFTLERGTDAWYVTSVVRTFLITHKVLMLTKYTDKQADLILSNAYKF